MPLTYIDQVLAKEAIAQIGMRHMHRTYSEADKRCQETDCEMGSWAKKKKATVMNMTDLQIQDLL